MKVSAYTDTPNHYSRNYQALEYNFEKEKKKIEVKVKMTPKADEIDISLWGDSSSECPQTFIYSGTEG